MARYPYCLPMATGMKTSLLIFYAPGGSSYCDDDDNDDDALLMNLQNIKSAVTKARAPFDDDAQHWITSFVRTCTVAFFLI